MSATNPAGEIIPLAPAHLRQAAEVMARAFHSDPLWRYLLPDDARRAALLLSSFRLFVRYTLRYGVGYTTTSVAGAACWLPPGNTTPTAGRMLRVAIHRAPAQTVRAGSALVSLGPRRRPALSGSGPRQPAHPARPCPRRRRPSPLL